MKYFLLLLFISSLCQAGGKTPIMFSSFHQEMNLDNAEPWTEPDFSGQEDSIGYGLNGFSVPAGLEERVAFWLDIYTKYTTDQGLLHDSRYVHIVYEEVDFRDIMAKSDLTVAVKRKMRSKRVKEAKKRIRERLKRLQKLSSPAGLTGEDLRYWYLFNKVDEKSKFRVASKDGRLRFQLGQKDRFIEGIYHSGRYLKQMEQIFKDYNLPVELTRLPFVESSFNLGARSRVGASGIWQIMPSTGKQLLRIDGTVDERNSPIRATEAAAKILRKNYDMLENWPLAVTGYNHGAYGIRRLVKKFNTDNLVEMVSIRKGRFGFASASFYASFLAALEAEKRAQKYYGIVYREKPMPVRRMKLDRRLSSGDLVKLFNGDTLAAKKYNPHLRRYFWKSYRSLSKRHFIYVPTQEYETYMARLKTIKYKKGNPKGGSYRVARGDTLGQIAENFNVRLSVLMDANGITNPRKIRSGQVLIIPD